MANEAESRSPVRSNSAASSAARRCTDSPDLSPTDYHFFKHLDNFLREKCFKNQDDAKNAFNDFIASRTPEFYETGINKLVSSWQKCIPSNGSYFD